MPQRNKCAATNVAISVNSSVSHQPMLPRNEPRRSYSLRAPCDATLVACSWCNRASRGAGGACGVTVMSY